MQRPASKPDAPNFISPEEYLRLEAAATEKHEYYAGEIRELRAQGQARALPKAGPPHHALCYRLSGLLFPQLEAHNHTGYTSDQRVQVLNASSYLYPDLSVVCGEALFNNAKNPENLLNPTLLVEVLSASTAKADRGEKFMLYRQLPSLRQYLMLDSQTIHAELYTRQDNNHWLFSETREPAAVLDLGSVGARLPLARLYQGVQLEG